MQTTEFRRPARFRINDIDAFLVRHPDGQMWVAVPAGSGGDKSMMIFEHGDSEAEQGAEEQGYTGRWIDESAAQEFEKHQARITGAKPGEYPWDDFQREALAAGIDPELATLGRAVMREADQHGWCDSLKYECGIFHPFCETDGMIRGAKEQPAHYRNRWEWLIATDGLRFDPWDRIEFSEDDHRWNEMWKRWEKEYSVEPAPESDDFLLLQGYRGIRSFYELNQLKSIDLRDVAIARDERQTTLYGGFAVTGSIATDSFYPGIIRSGIVRVESDGSETAWEGEVFITAE